MNELEPLSPDEFEALKQDVARHGVIAPIIRDATTGEVIDGHHRLRACQELGLPDPAAVELPSTGGDERRGHALRLNLLRRQVGPISWAKAYEQLAELEGIRLMRGGDRRSTDTVAVGRAAELAAELGVPARTARRRVALARELEPHPDLAHAVDSGELSANDAREQARKRALERKRQAAAEVGRQVALPAAAEIRVGDFAEQLATLPDASVDMVYTDPPYLMGNDLEWIYGELARQAARVLKPGASLIAYCGGYSLPRALKALEQHLTWWWPIAVNHAGGRHNLLPAKKVCVQWKPLLWFVKDYHGGDRVVDDMVGRSAPDKTLHDWAQSTAEAAYYIERLTPPGGLVVDPFCGSGTTLVAALFCGRRAIGIELDPDVAARARYRLAGEVERAA